MLPKWIVTIYVSGPITAENRFDFTKRKDIEYPHPLYSKIKVRNAPGGGLVIDASAYAQGESFAEKAALTFVGYAIDTLALSINLPITISLYDRKIAQGELHSIKREITIEDFSRSFDEARLLLFTERPFLNAVSWYRKGLTSENPIDKYLAYWNAIEVLGSNYHIKSEKTKLGIKNQIWSIFHQLYGDPSNWTKVVPDYTEWINNTYFLRNEVAHGSGSIGESNFLQNILESTEELKAISFRLLNDWRVNNLFPENKIDESARKRLDKTNWFVFGQTDLN